MGRTIIRTRTRALWTSTATRDGVTVEGKADVAIRTMTGRVAEPTAEVTITADGWDETFVVRLDATRDPRTQRVTLVHASSPKFGDSVIGRTLIEAAEAFASMRLSVRLNRALDKAVAR